jgi:hypothetical protein
VDRRTTIKWVLAASAAWPLAGRGAARSPASSSGAGYGSDPDLARAYKPGELWPLTLTMHQRQQVRVLADLILPADDHSPSASDAGVVEFLDEWISAPYPVQQRDRAVILAGLAWLDAEAARGHAVAFSDLGVIELQGICDAICSEPAAAPEFRVAAQFFAVFRDVCAGGFYSSPLGRKDLGYIGNVPLDRFDGPPHALLAALGLP